MWEVLTKHPRGRISLRNLPLLAASLFVAVLVCIGVSHTASAADATRTTDGFLYEGKAFTNQLTIAANDPRKFDEGTVAYEYQNTQTKKVEYLFFAKDVDPTTAGAAQYTTFDYTPPTTYSNQSPSPPVQVAITGDSQLRAEASGGCQVGYGMGWLLCPTGNFLAGAVDQLYKLVMMFLDVPPMMQNSPVYDMWNVIRSIANICFVIAFLIIIFSQITSLGISTYGIRKALPRLIMAAILVNISFYICALGIDLSNLLGHGVYGMLRSMMGIMDDARVTAGGLEQLAGTILGGSAAATVGVLWFSAATAGSALAATFIFLGMVISGALAVLTAFIILAARHALLILFTIISPLAFVALILPKTEEWFGKWRKAFLTLLVMFPLFSLIFAGAQLAGAAIIIGSPGNVYMAILGNAVQLMPLAFTAIIVKFSSGILGTIANMVNDKNRGLIDRARNFTNSQAEHHRKKLLAGQAGWNGGRKSWRSNLFRWTAQSFDDTERMQKRQQEGFEDASNARAFSTTRYRNADNYARRTAQSKELSQARLEKSWHRHLSSTEGKDTLQQYIDLRTTQDETTGEKANVENIYNDLRKGEVTKTTRALYGKQAARDMAQRAYIAAEQINATTIRKNQADQEVVKKLNEELLSNGAYTNALGVVEHRKIFGQELQKYATGIGNAKRMVAIEIEKGRKIEDQEANAAYELMKEFNIVDANDFVKLATGAGTGEAIGTDSRGNTMTFKFSDMDSRAAAIQWVAKNGAYSQKKALLLTAADPATNAQLAGFIQRELTSNGFGGMAPWANDKAISEMGAGKIGTMHDIMFHNFREIEEGRLKGEGLMTANATALRELFATYQDREKLNSNWDGYVADKEAMLTREKQSAGKSPTEITKEIAEFRSTIDTSYTAKYYDLMMEAGRILADPQQSARLNQQSKVEMEKARAEFFNSGLGKGHVAYRLQVKAAQDAADAGTATPADRALLDSFYKLYD